MNPVLFWFLICWFVLSATLTVAMVGRRRDPISPGTASLAVVINMIIVFALITWGGVL